ncbi:hypothetical protein [Rivularia sp. UHCC 0363]|uniref:hypothetical protein n=1 Tax=Rivularia sp. UHCC 0363 TaxID=3110244 RepID=UPI002B1F54B6|nr:hypothetical protein [Rivularia sp. UHCC 0363]MEA5598763.1 hypothetical protein [Rivularia sp. UHCC 0363]
MKFNFLSTRSLLMLSLVFPTASAAAYYCRIIDLSTVQSDVYMALRWRSLLEALSAWLEHIPGTVINRPGTGADNFSKPLPSALSQQIIDATAAFGLIFAGWDFKVTDDNQYWCLEANPMPGYDGYDLRLGGCITDSLLKLLAC